MLGPIFGLFHLKRYGRGMLESFDLKGRGSPKEINVMGSQGVGPLEKKTDAGWI